MPRSRKSPPAKTPHLAPGDLRIVQDFVNTFDHETGDDELSSPDELGAWLAGRSLLPRGVRLEGTDWRAALELRDGLRQLIRGHATGVVADGTVRRLNEALGEEGPRWRFAADGSLHVESGSDGWSAVRHRLLLIVYDAMSSARWNRLKTCHNQVCQRIFYDAAKNRIGKWCDMARCGNSVNAKAYRKRGRAGKRGRLTGNLIR
jgi:predicted RNA-binding Zn ribbon-like protein